jgi:hypothetical protein
MEGAIIAGVDPSRRAHEEKGRLCQMTQVVPCNRKMIHARGYDRYPQCQRDPVWLYFKIAGYDVLLLVMVHSLSCGWLSYLSAVSPELG